MNQGFSEQRGGELQKGKGGRLVHTDTTTRTIWLSVVLHTKGCRCRYKKERDTKVSCKIIWKINIQDEKLRNSR